MPAIAPGDPERASGPEPGPDRNRNELFVADKIFLSLAPRVHAVTSRFVFSIYIAAETDLAERSVGLPVTGGPREVSFGYHSLAAIRRQKNSLPGLAYRKHRTLIRGVGKPVYCTGQPGGTLVGLTWAQDGAHRKGADL